MNKSIVEKIIKFRDERDWKQFHNGKDLAISLSLEANELLEAFQWSGSELMCCNKIDKIKEELADVFIYATLIAECYGFDIEKIILEKIKINNEKYPVEKAKGRYDKYTNL